MKESKGMSMNQKEELRTQNMIRFIEAARELGRLLGYTPEAVERMIASNLEA